MTDGKPLERLRDVSKALLGNKYRLEVALAIAESERGRVYGHAICRAVPDLADNQAGKELARLEDAGLLAREAAVDGQLRIYYQRRESCHWGQIQAFAAEVLERPEDYQVPRLVHDDPQTGS